jgi:organic radical activating enzyme
MRCWFCCYPGITRTDIPDRRNLERLSPREFIDEAHAWTIPKVVFFGGEPALHHEYWSEATDLARECGLETGIHTNGYVNPWLAEKIASSFDEVVIGIKGSASRELYEKMTANSKVPLETLAIISHINPNVGVALLVSEAFQVSPEDDYRLGAYVRKNAGADIRVVLMTAREPPPNPPGLYYSNYTPVLSAATSAYKYSLQVGERLIQSGLTDVEVYDTRPNLRALSLDSSALRRLPIPRQRKCERSSLNPKRAQATIPSRD